MARELVSRFNRTIERRKVLAEEFKVFRSELTEKGNSDLEEGLGESKKVAFSSDDQENGFLSLREPFSDRCGAGSGGGGRVKSDNGNEAVLSSVRSPLGARRSLLPISYSFGTSKVPSRERGSPIMFTTSAITQNRSSASVSRNVYEKPLCLTSEVIAPVTVTLKLKSN
jgi:hypothetical protein